MSERRGGKSDAGLIENKGRHCRVYVRDARQASCVSKAVPTMPPLQVTHSCFVVGLVNKDLPLDAYARINNVRVAALVPAPKSPNNIHVCVAPLLRALRTAAGGEGAPPRPLQLRGANRDGSYTDISHVPYVVDVLADRMAAIKLSGVMPPAGCLSCHSCLNQGVGVVGRGAREILRMRMRDVCGHAYLPAACLTPNLASPRPAMIREGVPPRQDGDVATCRVQEARRAAPQLWGR